MVADAAMGDGNETVRHYKDLKAWQRSMDLVESVYRLTSDWPSSEQYGLTSQIRRASYSVPGNIAEGQGRTGSREFLHYLSIAHGSLQEIETYLLIAIRLRFSNPPDVKQAIAILAEVGRLLRGLIRKLQG